MKLKRIASILMCAALMGLSACGDGAGLAESAAQKSGRLSVVCTTFSCYDWSREMIGDRADEVELTYLLDKGADLHSYQPTAADMVKISDCDVFVYVGGESETWAEDALKEASNKNMKVVRLLDADGFSAKEEEVKEGMQAEEEEGEAEDEPEYDEHVWLSVKNAEVMCGEIEKAIAEADPENAAVYEQNCQAYTEKLSALDGQFADMAANAKKKTVIFADRFPFRYLCDDYGIDYYAAFVGCSAETEASFETVAFLAEKADETGADTIFTIENSDGRIAQAVINGRKDKSGEIAVLNSLQSVDKSQADSGVTYISLMEKNCETLRNALG
ncbi:metal ABC transporter substrate-binding protein [uncultured Ruminococcus sp.]|uniref:metal ABC transporter substrate-binding protein n=1 Tax=uncultured Ruminococcus sp. TaxID=165186 RepID=UPI000ED061EB|nr:metal ABC transporter substrate-binding protein [uncultured Ruminococcus sp.]HCJ41214.1 zinc ABC transporter substrate-binding protein [Ruminococcus sp.]